HAATATEEAQHTLRNTAAAVLGLVLLVSLMLAVSISVPVRRLTAATRRLAGGDRGARAPRGGSAEIDELAESFNTMADRIAHAEAELRAHHAELERHVAERTEQLHHLAHHDPLTQLPNRRKLAAHLASALARAGTRQRLALLFVDVDNFKSINDTLGHSFGDRVLQNIAERLHAATGPTGLLARRGGGGVTVRRWRKSDGRIASAAEFIHVAEKTGLIHELTDWILHTAAATAAAWRAAGWHRASVAINVSAPQFFESDFVAHVARTLQVTGLPASALELEITETVFQTGPATVDSLRQLRDLGVAVALDDFGIGYSSLTSLEQLPISRVKLDRQLTAAVDSNPRSAAIVRSVVALCHGLGLQVVAEGV